VPSLVGILILPATISPNVRIKIPALGDCARGPVKAMEQSKAFSFSRVTPPEQLRFTPKQAEELSEANGEGPAGAVAVEGTRRT